MVERGFRRPDSHFAPDHPTFATRYNNLAHICKHEGDRATACANFKKALAIPLKHFDETTPPSRAPASRCRPSAAASSPRPPRPGLLPGRNSRAARLSGQPAIRDQPARRASGA